MAVTKIKPIKSTLRKALDYIQNPDKTDGKMLVSSFGCSYETADIEFGFTLAQAIDKGNNLAHHLIQSFEPGEVDYEKAHEIGKQKKPPLPTGKSGLKSRYKLFCHCCFGGSCIFAVFFLFLEENKFFHWEQNNHLHKACCH